VNHDDTDGYAYESTIDQIIRVDHEDGASLRLPVRFIDCYTDEDAHEIIHELTQEALEVYYKEFDRSSCAGQGWPNNYTPTDGYRPTHSSKD
jgi:hypothetical protein